MPDSISEGSASAVRAASGCTTIRRIERRAYGASPVGGQSSALEMHWREARDSAEGAGKFGISFKVVGTDGVTAKLKVTSRFSTTSTDEIESTVDGPNQPTLV